LPKIKYLKVELEISNKKAFDKEICRYL